MFFEKNMCFFQKLLKVTNLLINATDILRILKVFKKWILVEKKDCFLEKNFSTLDNANGRKLAVECNWFSEISQNVEILGFLMKKTRWVFRKICEFSLKNANGTIFALPCDWNSKNQQNVQKNGVLKKLNGFFRKTLRKIASFAVECDWISKCSQNVKKLGFLLKNNEWVFRKKFDFFLKC